MFLHESVTVDDSLLTNIQIQLLYLNTFGKCQGSVLSKPVGSISLNSRNGWLKYLVTHVELHAKFVKKIFPIASLGVTAVTSHANGKKHKQGENFLF